MVVDPEFRNRGLGRSLIRKLVEIAADRGLESVIFEVVADRQEFARRAAQLLGFENAAVFPRSPSEDSSRETKTATQ